MAFFFRFGRILLLVLLRGIGFNGFLAGNHAVEMLGNVGVIADDDHDGRRAVLAGRGILQKIEPLFPFARQREQSILCFAINDFRFDFAAGEFFARFQVARDVFPQFEILGVGPPGVINGRQAGNFGDAAFDGINQTEIADNPREWRAFRVAAAVDVKRRR